MDAFSAAKPDAAVIEFDAQVEMLADRPIVRLPAAASAELPSRGQVAVVGTIDGARFSTVVEPDGRRGHWVPLDERTTGAADAEPGATISFAIAPATEWPEPDVPDDLGDALASAPDAAEVWSSTTPMARWEWVRWIGATRNPATRAKRVEVGISKLQSGKRRPCCFDLASCTDPELARSGKLPDIDHAPAG
ncbi:MAG: hypothetical protein JWL76_482 [Thermoleophilia bacterium]|nr:hypothetical protein [Thermoleophilia bacterium]